VRSGVAPDHPEVKSVIHDFEKVAAEDRFAFLGNVRVGEDVSLAQLRECYNAVVLAYGAAGDRELGVPGEHLKGVLSARAFVNWYNGHPAFRNLDIDLAGVSAATAVIFGQGNVAVDCARALTKSVGELAATDMSSHAVQQLRSR
jgi:adrenodoxin-NADP+ reductase